MKTKRTYTIIYRTGGANNFQWHRIDPLPTYREARAKEGEINQMGYTTLTHVTSELNSIGMPEGYDSHSVIDVTPDMYKS